MTLHNNETYDAVLQGAEPDKDLAVLKIVGRSSDTFSPISVGTSSNLQARPLTIALTLTLILILTSQSRFGCRL